MGKINIISNLSSKSESHTGLPFCKLDDRNIKIKNDKIEFSIYGEHFIKIGYQYYGNNDEGKIIHYEGKITSKEDEEWYLYKVPLLLSGKGKIKKYPEKDLRLNTQKENFIIVGYLLYFL